GRTAVADFFVRCNLPLPAVASPDDWFVEVAGTARDTTLRVAQLRELLPPAETTAVLQCAGNGRRHAATPVPGSQWANGAAGCASFRGVRVADLARALGGSDPQARFLTATGGEAAPSSDARVERSVPVAKGLADCLLAFEMNGEPLTVVHGAPIRLIVPGYFAVNSVKHVARLAFTRDESDAAIMRSRYRLAPPGASQGPSQPTCWAMPVKSWITSPAAGEVAAGEVSVTGVAFAGETPVARVEVSADGGASWAPAQLRDKPHDAAAWRGFSAHLALRRGRRTLVSRATDEHGNTQPRRSQPNAGGYVFHGWEEPAVVVEIAY
ncbi:MAG: sulfite oxidase, partial [Actinomycetota bacterium]|nr:sulfite oxidase [Actinomycetota bacterium]